jgi:tetrahydromethanopterin S-methyltransferase subunit F
MKSENFQGIAAGMMVAVLLFMVVIGLMIFGMLH